MILKVFFFLSFLWVDRFDKQRKVPEVTTRWLLTDLAAFSHRYFRRVARGRYSRVAKAFIVHGPYEVAIIIRDNCDVWSNVKDVKNNISVKLKAHFVNAVKNIDRQQTIHSTQFNATAAVPPGGRGVGAGSSLFPRQSIADMELILLELQPSLSMPRRKARKTYFKDRGKTLSPDGLNQRNEHWTVSIFNYRKIPKISPSIYKLLQI